MTTTQKTAVVVLAVVGTHTVYKRVRSSVNRRVIITRRNSR